ncbi:MAG: nuclear transport factor 2 family protein [Gemmatimonadales bacterium]
MRITTLFQGTRGDGPPRQPIPIRPGDPASEVAALDQEYLDATRSHDATWFRQHLSEDVVVVLGEGRRLRKPEFLATLRNAPRCYHSLVARGVVLRVFGEVVQVDAEAPWEMSDGTTGIARYLDTWVWLDGRWQVISAQVTPAARS